MIYMIHAKQPKKNGRKAYLETEEEMAEERGKKEEKRRKRRLDKREEREEKGRGCQPRGEEERRGLRKWRLGFGYRKN